MSFIAKYVALGILPEVRIISRPGEINPWDNPQFLEAVKKIGRKQLISAGVSTDVCVAFPALAAVAEGYEVYAVIDASGTWSKTVQEVRFSAWRRQASI